MESESIQAVADGGGTAIWTVIAGLLWKILQAIQKGSEHLGAISNNLVTQGQAAERHYDTNQKLYASIKVDHAVHEATAQARAEHAREMIRLRAQLESLEKRSNNSGPIRITDDEDTG